MSQKMYNIKHKVRQKLAGVKHELDDYAVNRKAVKTSHKYLIIESDDWGSIRTPNADTLRELEALGDTPCSQSFIHHDSLESADDLEQLFDTLRRYTDKNGRKLCITANFAMANADFEKIEVEGAYCREPFYETYDRYYGNRDALMLIHQGMEDGLFKPQLHCLEHLRVNQWMEDLRSGKADTVIAFEKKMYGIGSSHSADNVYGYMDAFNYSTESDRHYLASAIQIACEMFEKTFGFKSESFTASCYVWDDFLEQELQKNGIYHIQTGISQILPAYSDGGEPYKRIHHYTGETNQRGQLYTVRNCEYEPSLGCNTTCYVKRCIESIDHAFAIGRPAIISSHRFNYIGSLNPKNRADGLQGLRQLMDWVVLHHPDVEFLTSDEFGQILFKNNNQ